MSINTKMSQVHEAFLVKMLGGRKTKASGSQWQDQMDGRHARREQEFAFAWDGKSTFAKSIGLTRVMWEKAKEQAHGERPLLPLRFYDTSRLDVGLDLVVMDLNDFVELLERANGPQRASEDEALIQRFAAEVARARKSRTPLRLADIVREVMQANGQ